MNQGDGLINRLLAAPAPIVAPLTHRTDVHERASEEWQANYDATYSTDAAYPAATGLYQGQGALRQYEFARITYYPFSYQPQSERLLFHPGLTVSIDYQIAACYNNTGRAC